MKGGGGGRMLKKLYLNRQPIPVAGLHPASLAQAGRSHRHHHCTSLAHPAHLSSDQWPEKQVRGLGVPSKYFISSKDVWLSMHPLIPLPASNRLCLCEVHWINASLKISTAADTVF